MKQKEGVAIVRKEPEGFLGDVLYPENRGFEEAIAIWNGAIKQRPAMVLIPETETDVKIAVNWAAMHGLSLSVLGGGHDWAGRALNDKGIVISMKKFKKITIDAVRKTAVVGGGVTVRELADAAAASGFVAVTGTVGAVGFTGFTLGGGYGLLTPSYGLSIDNVVGADVVLPDARLVHTNENRFPDLFWAIRGGGGNFGVVTALHIRLHPARPVLAGMLLFDWREAGL
ncbi:MAG TPA: FAD-binding oxidoreductase, partial [Chitinophagaceae bacterium]|nr:FAD-binding oxidoreductase [Chitinophagaceae bacterium]